MSKPNFEIFPPRGASSQKWGVLDILVEQMLQHRETFLGDQIHSIC